MWNRREKCMFLPCTLQVYHMGWGYRRVSLERFENRSMIFDNTTSFPMNN